MKVASIIYAALYAACSIEAAAIANPAPNVLVARTPDPGANFCRRPGEACFKLKRAAEAAADALAEAAPLMGPFCRRPGEPCSKAKRDALALAEAIAEAQAAANPEVQWCYRPGESCSKAKRAALASAEALAEAEAAASPNPEAGRSTPFLFRLTTKICAY